MKPLRFVEMLSHSGLHKEQPNHNYNCAIAVVIQRWFDETPSAFFFFFFFAHRSMRGLYVARGLCIHTQSTMTTREEKKKTNEIISTYTSLPCVSSFRNHALDVVVLFLVRYSTRSYMPL